MSDKEFNLQPETVQTAGAPQAETKKPKFVTKDVIMCVVVLVAIALVAGVLLGVMNWVTYVDPDAAIMAQVADKYGIDSSSVVKMPEMVINNPGAKSSVSSVFKALDDEKNVKAYAYSVVGSGAYKGTVEFVIYVTPEGKIDEITVYSSSETPSIGGKVLKKENLAKYNGYDLTKVTDYDSADVSDASIDSIYITGATMTTKSVLNAVRTVAYAFNHYTTGVAQ